MIKKFNAPRLRFPGFTDEWEQRKLGDYLSIPEKEILEVRSSNDLLTVKLNLGGVELGASRDTLSLGSTVYYKRYAGQFIYGKQNFFNGSMGIIPQNLDGKGSSADVPSFNISNIETNYLYTYVSRESYWRPKVAAASGTGSKRIHEKTLLDFNIDVPSINEQKLISNTFYLINSFITLHQHKITNLIKKKKSLLQKLFPINGNPYPEIRFPGFNDAWEQRKLGEFVKIISGDAPSTFISGNCIYVKVDDLNYSDRIQLSSSNFVNANPKAHLVNQGAPIFPKRGAAIMTNKVRIMGKDGYLDTNMMALIPEEIDKDFLFTFIQKTGLYKIADTSTIPQINNKHIEPYMIQVPSEKEQAYIGVVFEKIDKIITLHQRKLNHLKLQKKALLQQLFV